MTDQNNPQDDTTTHFGYEEVLVTEKAKKVAQVFHSVASKYDIMNDLMSLGIHRLWKWLAINQCQVRNGMKMLDLASGTGDLALQLANKMGDDNQLVLADINNSMLNIARDRLLNAGLHRNIEYVLANAEALPFTNSYFHLITIAFGLRNVTDKQKALESMFRVLKPGGKCLILEFSKPTTKSLNAIYDFYSFNILPKIGHFVANDEASYQYLAESIRMHPGQDTLQDMMKQAGFENTSYTNLSGGIVALHKGYKY